LTLETLTLRNFTAFSNAEFNFAPQLNVIVGENGAGKTHILKVAYSTIYVTTKIGLEADSPPPTKTHLQAAIADKLISVFKPDELGRLVRRNPGRQRCEVNSRFSSPQEFLQFSFNTSSRSETIVTKAPLTWGDKLPVYLPTRELLTIYPGFVSLYETTHLPFEETWRDTCLLLGAPLARGPREKRIGELLEPLEEAMGGKILLTQAGRFYLNTREGNLEMHLVAEGLRKLAMIARLIATGSLVDKGFLFWDEPEANLNPKIIRVIARTILHLCQNNIQMFIASHSLFLLRELDVLLNDREFKTVTARFFGLHPGENGFSVQQGDSIDDIGQIDALQEELRQSDRYLLSEAV
jgi:energy-coupling factor transporter ATP-binding protein EcfA2